MPGAIHPMVVTAVLSGLRRVRPELVPDEATLEALTTHADGVPLAPYRRILDRVLRAGGGAALLAAGVSQTELRHPFVFVLLNSETPAQLLDKLRRLERFIHSRHHVRVLDSGPLHLHLEHRSDANEPPQPAEDLAACGQHLALLQEIGCDGVQVRFGDGPWLAPGEPAELPPDGDYARWEIRWDSFHPTRRPMAGLDELVLASADARELQEQPDVVRRLEAVVRRDLARGWRLEAVAAELGQAGRSFQRALRAAGTTWSAELDRVRVEEAAHLLRCSDLSITEIGYVCGFADGAHFGRRFRRRFGSAPSQFRAQSRE